MSRPPVAIAHDYLTQRGGAERVVLAIARAFPGAPVHTSVHEPDGTYPEFAELDVVTTPLQRVGPLRRDPRRALPVLAPVVSRHRIEADLVVASSSGWAHGFDTDGAVLVYCHAPARWLYQSENYLGGPRWRSPKGIALAALDPWLRRWDAAAAARADRYLANSRVVRDRIRAAYGIDAEVLPPPFGVDADGPLTPVPELSGWAEEGYLLVVSRLLPYKNVDAAIEAVRGADHRLVVVGDGPLREELAATAPPNVRLVRDLTDAQLRWVYAHARRLLAPSLEDFRSHPARGSGSRRPDRRPAGWRVPRHGAGGHDRGLRRRGDPAGDRRRDRHGRADPLGCPHDPGSRRRLRGGALRRAAEADRRRPRLISGIGSNRQCHCLP